MVGTRGRDDGLENWGHRCGDSDRGTSEVSDTGTWDGDNDVPKIWGPRWQSWAQSRAVASPSPPLTQWRWLCCPTCRGHWRGPTLGHGMETTRSILVGWGQRCPQDVGTLMVTKMAELGTEQSGGIAITTVDPMEVALLSHVRGTLERSNLGPWDGENQVHPCGVGTTMSPRSGDVDGDQDGGAGHRAERWHRHHHR